MTSIHRSSLLRTALATAGGLLLCARFATAASTASDNAAAAIYGTNGWTTGTNGGTGFGAWTIVGDPSGGGEFIGTSGNNGSANPNGGGGNIDSSGVSFGMYSNTGTSSATRSFTGSLNIGQTFSMKMDNGYLSNGGLVGFNLLGSNGATRFQFNFTGGGNGYNAVGSTMNNTGSSGSNNESFTDGGMSTSFTLTGTNSYSFTVNFNDGNKDTYTGTLSGTAGTTITGFQAFSTAVGTGGQNDAFFNSPAISGVPEPTTYVWLALSFLGLMVWRGRRRAA